MGDSQMHFAVKSIGLSRYGGRKPQSLLDAARHNLREIQAELGSSRHIDPARTIHNTVLAGPSDAAGVVTLANQLLSESGVDVGKMRRDHCQALELVFSLPPQSLIEPTSYFEKCLKWAESAYGLPILLATAHHDEGAGHLHVLLLPIERGAYVGSKPVGRGNTKKKSDAFFLKVAGPVGLARAAAKLRGVNKELAISAVLAAIKAADPTFVLAALMPHMRTMVERDPTPFFLALRIPEETIRATAPVVDTTTIQKPIGFEAGAPKPIGFAANRRVSRNLSCVGFASHNPDGAPEKYRDKTPAEIGFPSDTMITGGSEDRSGIDEVDGIVRVRDEHCDDLSAWNDSPS